VIDTVACEETRSTAGTEALVAQKPGRGRRDPLEYRRFVESNESERRGRSVWFVAEVAGDSVIHHVLAVKGERILLQDHLTVVTGVAQGVRGLRLGLPLLLVQSGTEPAVLATPMRAARPGRVVIGVAVRTVDSRVCGQRGTKARDIPGGTGGKHRVIGGVSRIEKCPEVVRVSTTDTPRAVARKTQVGLGVKAALG